MKLKHLSWFQFSIGVLVLFMGSWAVDLWAAETAPPPIQDQTYLSSMIQYLKDNFTRASWDLIMRWVNFLILVAVIVKYARAPIINFLKGKRAETARAIERIEAKKRQAEEKVKERQIQLEASKERLKLIQDRIVSEGQRQKEMMIASAKQESQILLASAKAKIESQIRDAYQSIRTELIEMAIDKAMTKLPEVLTTNDHEQMIGVWLEEARR